MVMLLFALSFPRKRRPHHDGAASPDASEHHKIGFNQLNTLLITYQLFLPFNTGLPKTGFPCVIVVVI